MLMLLRIMNVFWCEVYLALDWVEHGEAYEECLRTAQGNTERVECYMQLMSAIGQSSLDYASCLF